MCKKLPLGPNSISLPLMVRVSVSWVVPLNVMLDLVVVNVVCVGDSKIIDGAANK